MDNEKVCHVPADIIERAGGGLKGLVLMCLWSNPVISAVGCTPNMVANMTKYTGLSGPFVIDSITALEQAGQIMVDRDTNEVLTTGWLNFNYLQDRSAAERPAEVMSAMDAIKSDRLREALLKDIDALDVQYDANSVRKLTPPS